MAADPHETKRVRALAAVAEGAARSWVRGSGLDRLTFQLANPQTRVLHGVRVFSVECTVRRGGMVIYDDRVNMPNPATAILNAAGEPVDNPLEAIRETLFDVVRATTDGFQRPRLERNPDGSFRGDTLAVRSGTADGHVLSNTTTWAATQDGAGLAVTTTGNNVVEARQITSSNWSIRQGFLGFDTSSLGSATVVSNAVLTLYADAASFSNADTTTLEWYSYDWGGTLETTDFRDCSPSTNITNLPKIAHIALSAWTNTADAANDLTEDSGAASSVNKTGTTYMVGLLAQAYGAAPSANNILTFRSADEAGTAFDPLLTVTYTFLSQRPTIIRQAVQRSAVR